MSDAIRCPICVRRDPRDGLTVCDTCLGRLDDDLARIVELTRLAAGYSAKRLTTGEPGTSGHPSAALARLEVIDAQTGTEADRLCESWERLCREHLSLAPYGTVWPLRNAEQRRSGLPAHIVHIDASAGFLRAQLLRLAETLDFPIEDMAREFHDLAERLQSIDPEPRCDEHKNDPEAAVHCPKCLQRTQTRLRCPADHPDADGRQCGHWLYFDASRPRDDVTCRRCSSTWTADRLVLVALSTPGDPFWMTAEPICSYLSIGAVTLNKWVRDGHVTKRGTLYNVQQVLSVVHAAR